MALGGYNSIGRGAVDRWVVWAVAQFCQPDIVRGARGGRRRAGSPLEDGQPFFDEVPKVAGWVRRPRANRRFFLLRHGIRRATRRNQRDAPALHELRKQPRHAHRPGSRRAPYRHRGGARMGSRTGVKRAVDEHTNCQIVRMADRAAGARRRSVFRGRDAGRRDSEPTEASTHRVAEVQSRFLVRESR